jgi:hypothetical protein
MRTAIRYDSNLTIDKEKNMQHLKTLLSSMLVLCSANVQTQAQQAPQPASVIFENVRIFNGTSDQLSSPSNVLIMGNVITAISTTPIAAPPETSG